MHPFNYMSYGYHGPSFLSFLFSPIALVWLAIVVVLKGYSLWHAARRGEMWWFIALLVLNTAGILELVYIIFILKKFKDLSSHSRHHEHHHDHENHAGQEHHPHH